MKFNVDHLAAKCQHVIEILATFLIAVRLCVTFFINSPSNNKVPKKSKTDETSLFLNEVGQERSFLDKVKSLWTSPRSKCYLLMVGVIMCNKQLNLGHSGIAW